MGRILALRLPTYYFTADEYTWTVFRHLSASQALRALPGADKAQSAHPLRLASNLGFFVTFDEPGLALCQAAWSR
jgi:hypothetical protein